MRAARSYPPEGDLRIEGVPRPDVAPDEVLVEVERVGFDELHGTFERLADGAVDARTVLTS